MDIHKFLKAYRKLLTDNFSPERAIKEKLYLYSDLEHYGVSVWKIGDFVKLHTKEILDQKMSEVIQLTKLLWSKPSHEEKFLALELLKLHLNKLNTSDMTLIEKMMRESRSWAFLDNLIIPIMPHILEKDKSAYKYLKKWIAENDFWIRRSALLAQLMFFKKGENGDTSLFFKMAESQFNENWIDKFYKDQPTRKRAKFFIRKAIGWNLREMSRNNPELVIGFVKDNKDKMSGLTFREATRKMSRKQQDAIH